MHQVTLRPAARMDVEGAATWYAKQGGVVLESRFIESFRVALGHISSHPVSGYTRYGGLTKFADLRFWQVKGFPYLVFYRDAGDYLDVWRVLHAERDIPAWLREES